MKATLTFVIAALLATSGALADESIATINAASLRARLQAKQTPLVVDVREIEEFESGHIAGAFLAPLRSVKETVSTANVPKDREIVLVCRSGRRSAKAYAELARLGYTRLLNLEGGMLSWEKLGYPVVKAVPANSRADVDGRAKD